MTYKLTNRVQPDLKTLLKFSSYFFTCVYTMQLGILMTLAWLLFAFVGLFTARYMRQVWEPTKLLGEKAWFTVSNYGKDNNTQSLTLTSDLDWHIRNA